MNFLSFGRYFLLLLALGFVTGMASCKKDDDDGNNNTETDEPFVTSASTFSDPNALPIATELQTTNTEAYGYALTPKTQLQAFSSFMLVPATAQYSTPKTGPGTYTWNYQGYQGVYTITDGGSQWDFSYVWTIQGSTYLDINGWEKKDGSAGFLQWEFDATERYTIDWSATSQGGYSIDTKFISGGVVDSRYVGVYNSDGSGSIDYFSEGDLYYTASWNASGSGTYTSYNSDGSVADSGSF